MRVFLAACMFALNSLGALEISQEIKSHLVLEAAAARLGAYAPYSNYLVGAAVLTESGQIFTGCNVENASYGLTVCAERVAIFKAVAESQRDIAAVAVVVEGGGSPCGACRQVLNEFNPHMLVIYGNENGTYLGEDRLTDLLPKAFGPQNLKK